MTRNAKFRPTRRAALLWAGAALAAPALQTTAFAQGQTPSSVPIRRSAHELTERDQVVQSLRRGLTALRERDLAMKEGLPHPRGWRQAALYLAQISGPAASGADPEDLNAEIIGGWWFLPWNRLHLAIVERWLRRASGDPTLALPYWDVHANPTVPPIFTGDPASNPLAHAARGPGLTREPAPTNGAGRQTERQAVRALNYLEFAGGRPRDGRFAPGHLEMEAHNSGHAFVGGDMGDFATAALDPLYYAHHANVDRLWEVWKSQGGDGRKAPAEAVWGARRLAFPGGNASMLSAATRDAQDTRDLAVFETGFSGGRKLRLGYAYDRADLGGFGGVSSAAPSAAAREFSYALEAEGEATVSAAPRPLKLVAPPPPSDAPPIGGRPSRAERSGANGHGSAEGAAHSAGGHAGEEKPAEKPSEKPAEQSAEKPAEKPAEGASSVVIGAPPVAPAATVGVAIDVVVKGIAIPHAPARLVLEARRPDAEPFVLSERVIMPFLSGEAAEKGRLSLSMEAGAGLRERNIRPGDANFSLRLESAAGVEQVLAFESAVLRYR